MDDAAAQVETLARAICAADDRDPEARVPRPAGEPSDGSAEGIPQWRLYEAHARRMIAAQNALGER